MLDTYLIEPMRPGATESPILTQSLNSDQVHGPHLGWPTMPGNTDDFVRREHLVLHSMESTLGGSRVTHSGVRKLLPESTETGLDLS